MARDWFDANSLADFNIASMNKFGGTDEITRERNQAADGFLKTPEVCEEKFLA